MNDAFNAEIAKLSTWIKTAGLPEMSRVIWCMNRLPNAYKEFTATYESRYAADIARHEQAALLHLADELGATGSDRVEKLRGRFETLNERFGLPALPVPARPAASRKVVTRSKPRPGK